MDEAISSLDVSTQVQILDLLIELKEKYGYEVMLDGACSPERVETLSKVGVKGFILGTSALFGKEKSYKEIVKELRSL